MAESLHHSRRVDEAERIAIFGLASLGFVLLHLACLLIFWLKFSWVALAACFVCYFVRAFGITAGYHRYFAHRAFRTSRVFQFVLAWLGAAAAQRGPLWWAAHHRHHHRHSDTDSDIHSPVARNLWWAHMGWIVCRKYDEADLRLVRDWCRYPELRWLDRYFLVPPVTLAASLLIAGLLFERYAPGLHASWPQMLVYGFALSTVLLYHSVFSVNSLAHAFGRRRFATKDQSRNNWFVALVILGEGWHNNHHRYPAAARFGVACWEIDVGHCVLVTLSRLRLVWDLRSLPRRLDESGEGAKAATYY
jgi:stearoyl-CoA desaturase (Delta-9 desaturase)